MKTKRLLWYAAAALLMSLTRALADTHYVDAASTNAVPPFTNWANAAAVIQDAVDAAVNGDEIVVTNGVYRTGVRDFYDMRTRVVVTKLVTVRSVNGPSVTSIVGSGQNSPEPVRCIYLTNGAVLAGFTLTNGAATGGWYTNGCGGGAWCEGLGAVLSNCVVAGCWSYDDGGGVFGGSLNNCVLRGNEGFYGGGACSSRLNNCTLTGNWGEGGGGAYASTLNNCTLTDNGSGDGGGTTQCVLSNCTLTGNSADTGGGASGCALTNCTLTGNSAYAGGGVAGSTLGDCILQDNWTDNPVSSYSFGGGAYGSTLNNCLVTGNSARDEFGLGGGAYASTLNNCTLTGNWADSGGGVRESTLTNCIVYYNASPGGANYYSSTFNYCSTTPDPGSGVGNITNQPVFVDLAGGNLRVQSNSPCINAGNNDSVSTSTDLDGRPRIVGGVVDMGAYEYQGPGMGEFIGWLRQCNLPTGGLADYVDTDHDGHNNWQEWMAGTHPTSGLSVLRLASPVITPTSVTLTWTSVTNRTYILEQATNLGGAPAFSVLCSNLAGLPGTTSWTDTNVPISSSRFYRLRVTP